MTQPDDDTPEPLDRVGWRDAIAGMGIAVATLYRTIRDVRRVRRSFKHAEQVVAEIEAHATGPIVYNFYTPTRKEPQALEHPEPPQQKDHDEQD